MHLIHGDCLDVLTKMEDNTFDVVCTDPPYGLKFMGKGWDRGIPGVEYWREVLRVAKPGAFLTAFGGTRTHHRLMSAIEDAGWEIRDCSMLFWLFGTGMPKGLDVSKALDKAAKAEREVVGSKLGQPGYSLKPNDTEQHNRTAYGKYTNPEVECAITAPASELAKLYDGYNVALKPSYEPIVVARKPLVGTVAQNVQQYGTGGLNIDASRVGPGSSVRREDRPPAHGQVSDSHTKGRWPPNVLLQHTADCTEEACSADCPCTQLNRQSGNIKSPKKNTPRDTKDFWFNNSTTVVTKNEYGDEGGASRFFPCFHYSSKASRKERAGSTHPTVKPLAIVEWLLKLTSPPASTNPTVLDPFVGSGTTIIAAHNLGIGAVGIEKEEEYILQAQNRIDNWTKPRKSGERE